MKRIVTISCLLLMVIGAMSTVQAQKFGYVNSTAILAEMPEVKQMEANLEALQKQLQKKGQSMVEYGALVLSDATAGSFLESLPEGSRSERAQASF